MDDWSAEADESREHARPDRVVQARAADPAAVAELAELIIGAATPALVVGAGADDAETWARARHARRAPAVSRLPGVVRRHGRASRRITRSSPAICRPTVRGSAGRWHRTTSCWSWARPCSASTRRSTARWSRLEHGSPSSTTTRPRCTAARPIPRCSPGPVRVCSELARLVPARTGEPPAPFDRPAAPAPPAAGEPLRAGHVLAGIAERLPRDAILIEETPSNRPELCARIPAREPLGFLSAAMGGLGFALPAAVGLRLARPDRPVAAIVGDGSSLYGIQALWSAAHYRAGALFVILSNGGYAVMDRLVEQQGGAGPWPTVDVDVAALSRAFGCAARTIETYDELDGALAEVLPDLGERGEPLLLEVKVAPDDAFSP